MQAVLWTALVGQRITRVELSDDHVQIDLSNGGSWHVYDPGALSCDGRGATQEVGAMAGLEVRHARSSEDAFELSTAQGRTLRIGLRATGEHRAQAIRYVDFDGSSVAW